MQIHVYFHDADAEKAQLSLLKAVQTLIAQGAAIMSEITDLKASVAELKKDNARMIVALTDVRASNADIQAKLDEALASTHLNAEDRAALDEIKTMVADSDAATETAVPEVPAPTPEPTTEG